RPTCFVDVQHGDVRFGQRLADELAAMTVLRLQLAAHDRYLQVLFRCALQSSNTSLIAWLKLQFGIIDTSIRRVALGIVRESAEQITHVNVSDIVLGQGLFKRGFREVRAKS